MLSCYRCASLRPTSTRATSARAHRALPSMPSHTLSRPVSLVQARHALMQYAGIKGIVPLHYVHATILLSVGKAAAAVLCFCYRSPSWAALLNASPSHLAGPRASPCPKDPPRATEASPSSPKRHRHSPSSVSYRAIASPSFDCALACSRCTSCHAGPSRVPSQPRQQPSLPR
jgi:hypothetical protein